MVGWHKAVVREPKLYFARSGFSKAHFALNRG